VVIIKVLEYNLDVFAHGYRMMQAANENAVAAPKSPNDYRCAIAFTLLWRNIYRDRCLLTLCMLEASHKEFKDHPDYSATCAQVETDRAKFRAIDDHTRALPRPELRDEQVWFPEHELATAATAPAAVSGINIQTWTRVQPP
jgi:hypothetical protein